MVTRIYCKKFLDQSGNPLDLHLTGNLHYFYGYNGSGKSSILRLVGSLLQLKLKDYDFLHRGDESLLEVNDGRITFGYSSEDRTVTHNKRGWVHDEKLRSHRIAVHDQYGEDKTYGIDEELDVYDWKYPKKEMLRISPVECYTITHDNLFHDINLTHQMINALSQEEGVADLIVEWFNDIWHPKYHLHYKINENGRYNLFLGTEECKDGCMSLEYLSAGMLKTLTIIAFAASFVKGGRESVLIVDDFPAVLDNSVSNALIGLIPRICAESDKFHFIFAGHSPIADRLISSDKQIECNCKGFEPDNNLL